MTMQERVPMRPKSGGWINAEDIDLQIRSEPRVGVRSVSMVIDEAVLAQIGAKAFEAAVEQYGKHVAYEHMDRIQGLVVNLLLDKTWLMPIVENELRRATRDMVLSLWNNDEKKAMRDWFDVFTAACLRANDNEKA
jgi:hypothetical protein